MSVIVPVRNGAADVAELLACLERQTLPREQFEIVIGDDGSTDGGTDGIETRDGHVRVVRDEPLNAYRARNVAVKESRGRVLAFCDADCRPAPHWIENGLAALESADIVAGRIRFEIPPQASVWSLLDAESTKNHARLVELGVGETANLFVPREVFERVGQFDESQPGYGDYEFVARCVAHGTRLVYAERALVLHPVRTSRRAFLRNVWSMNRSYGAFEGRRGRLPEGVWLRSLVPFVQTFRSRRRFGMSLVLDANWLSANGFRPSRRRRLEAVPVTYVLLPYLSSVAQACGWLEGWRQRRAFLRAATP